MVKHSVLKVSTFLVMILFVMLVFAACGGTVNNITLSFMVDGSVYEKIETTGTTSITMPDNPSKYGYTFDGWYWDNDTWNQPFTANSLMDAPLSSSMSVYAKLTPVAYAITYQADGGIYQNPNTYTIEDNLSLLPAEKEGYTFDGWYNGDTKVTEIAVGSKGNLTLIAHWSLTTYQITYENTKGAENKNSNTYTIESEAIALSAISADGYTFDGWYDGETKVAEIPTGSIGNLTLTAQWTPISYNITYEDTFGATNSNPTEYTIESSITLTELSRDGYTFEGWYNGENRVTEIPAGSIGNLTLTAKWSPITYQIIYKDTKDVSNSNPVSYTIESEAITLTDLTATGYTFDGWYNGNTKVTQIEKGSMGSITLTAKWTLNGYTIAYHNVDGATNQNPESYNVEDEPLELSDASKTGYTFLGWYTKEEGGEKLTEIAVGTVGNLDLYARWEAITYTATFKIDGETVAEIPFAVETVALEDPALPERSGYSAAWESYTLTADDITINAVYTPVTYTITYLNTKDAANTNRTEFTIETPTFALSDISVTGYTFDGWYDGDTKVTQILQGTTGAIELTAHWTPVTYTVTYLNTKDAENANRTEYTIETPTFALSDISVTGYTFDGWYDGETKITQILQGTTGAIELTAHWTPITYIITYLNTKDAENTNRTEYTIETPTFALSDISVTGYTFDGWYDGETKVTEILQGTIGAIELTAHWAPITYNVTYLTTKDAENANRTEFTIETPTFAISDISVTGYTFDGWYNGETKVTQILQGTTGAIELTAHWMPIVYNLTLIWDEDIGRYADGISNPATYTVEDTINLQPLYNYTYGYDFAGWYTEKNEGMGTLVTSIPEGSVGDRTYYAHWTLVDCTITYHNTQGATNTNPATYTVESDPITIYPLSRTGYTFDGWFTDDTWETPAATTIPTGSFGNLDYYAKWTPVSYDITYVLYGGTYTGESNPETYTIEDAFTFVDPTLTGYVFAGWHTQAEGGDLVTGIAEGTTGTQTFYAHWTHISTMTFQSNGGSAVSPITLPAGTSVTEPTTPTKDYYDFAGWYSNTALANSYTFSTMPAENITLYAKWTPTVYSITYELNGGTNSKNNPATYTVESAVTFAEPAKTGYTFVGWFTDPEFTSAKVDGITVGTHGDLKFYANFRINQYTVTFESNSGTSVEPITQNYATTLIEPESPAKNGYTFCGWYSNSALTQKYTFTTVPAQNITLYAKWNLVTYNITYQLDGGTNHKNNPATYTITSSTISLQNPTKTGYNFIGWFSDSALTQPVTQIANGSYGNKEVFAKWEAIVYTATYHGVDASEHTNPATYTIATDITLLADAVRAGYRFDGWYTSNAYTTRVTSIAGGAIGNVDVYAKFTANTYYIWLDGTATPSYTVHFDLNGAEGSVASQTITESTTLSYPAIPTRDGYVFGGWFDNAECTGATYDFTALITSDVELFAKWIDCGENTGIAIGANTTFALDGTNEQRFVFVPLVSGNVTLTTTGSYDTYGILYSAADRVLAQDDDTGTGSNFQIIYNVTAGEKYIIAVRGFGSAVSGSVTLYVSGNTTVPAGGYTVIGNRIEVTFGSNFTLPVPTMPEGYKFLGWQKEDGTLVTNAAGEGLTAWNVAEDTALTSKRERTVYTVTFNTQGGSTVAPVTLAFGERLDLNLYTTTLSGRSFLGWYRSLSDSQPYNATTMPDENITLYARWTTFSLGTIKYNEDKVAISVHDEITPELFGIICLDSDGKLATITLDEDGIAGTFAAGETITLYFTATSGGKSKPLTITGVKVYGDPTISYITRSSVNLSSVLTADLFYASGKDTYGNDTAIRVTSLNEMVAGKTVNILIESIDAAGNITSATVENVKVYGKPIITYNTEKKGLVVSFGENPVKNGMFSEKATDSFGSSVSTSVELYEGDLTPGTVVTIRISATDSHGNTAYADVPSKVYGDATISEPTKTDFRIDEEITADKMGIVAVNSFGKKLNVELIHYDHTPFDLYMNEELISENFDNYFPDSYVPVSYEAGNTVLLIAVITDSERDADCYYGGKGYRFTYYQVSLYATPTITYNRAGIKVGEDATNYMVSATLSFDLNGGSGSIPSQIVTETVGLTYPAIPTRNGYVFRGWYTTSDCTTLFDFSANVDKDTTVYAGWEKMVANYYSRTIDVHSHYNTSSSPYSFSTSTSPGDYTYFTALTTGTYNVYYRKGSSSDQTYISINNVTKGTAIYSTYNTNTSYSSYSFAAHAGDVICVNTRSTKNNYTATIYMYVTGSQTPVAGGKYIPAAQKVLNAIATDSFGNPLAVTVTLKSGAVVKGQSVVYTLTATDHLGNVATLDTAAIPVYDVNDINLTYYGGLSDKVKLTSQGEEFMASATDTYGNACKLRIEAAEGYTLAGGNTVTLYIVATDAAGNEKYSDPISDIKVYDLPTILLQNPAIIYEDTNWRRFFTAVDSFGEAVTCTIVKQGNLTVGEVVAFTVTTTEDDAGNIRTEVYSLEVMTPTEFVYDDTILTAYNGNREMVVIPDGTTEIKASVFQNNTAIQSVVIPDSVTSIGSSAFSGCSSLASITVSAENLYYCSIDGILYNRLKTTLIHIPKAIQGSVAIPNSVTSIGSSAFSGCSGLTSITIPNSVTSIGNYAFSGCSGLTSITIPNKVTSIGSSTFFGCSGLTSITIPYSVTSIGSSAFSGCSSLTSITIPNSVTSIGSSAFSGCSGLTSITIPNKVTSIGSSAFSGCSSLTGITIPFVGGSKKTASDTYQYPFGYIFGTSSYTGGTATTQSYYGSSTSSTTSTTYYIPTSLKSVTVTGGNILYGAFYKCSGLTSVTIGDSVTSIGTDAFYDCSSLESLSVPFVGAKAGVTPSDTYQYPFGYIFGTSSYTGGTATTQSYCGSSTSSTTTTTYYIPTSLKSVTVTGGNILYGAFYKCSGLTSVTIGDSVTSIGDRAFYECSGLTSVTIGNSVTSIERYAFKGCSGLKTLVIRSGVISLPNGLLNGCSSLESITIPFVGAKAGVTASDTYQYPFGYIFGTSSYTGGTKTTQYYYGSSTTSTTNTTYYIPTSLKSVTVTGGDILYGAFGYCSGLTSITIGESVTSIEKGAFYGCSSLESLTIPFVGAKAGVTASDTYQYPFGYIFGTNTYTGGTATTQYYYGSSTTSRTSTTYYIPTSLKSVTVTSGNILCGAFWGCSGLTSITILNKVTSIESYAFYNCTSLTSVTIPDSVTSIGSYAFYGCSGLTSITIPNSVTSIGNSAFSGCSGLTSVTIPNSITSIGGSAFSDCSNLQYNKYDNAKYLGNASNPYLALISATNTSITSCTISEKTKVIGNYAFSGCSGLTSITIGSNVTSIGDEAFWECPIETAIIPTIACKSVRNKNLKTVIITSGTYIENSAFWGCSELMSITIPNSVTSIGMDAFGYCFKLIEVRNLSALTITAGSLDNGGVGSYAKHIYQDGESYLYITDGGYVFYENGEDAYLVAYNGNETELTLPDNYNGKNYGINAGAFYNCSGLTSITIPNSVTSIGWYAFSGCSGLKSITIPNGVTSIEKYAFTSCSGLTSITFVNTSGWYRTTTYDATSGTKVTVTDASANATNLVSNYSNYYWYRK